METLISLPHQFVLLKKIDHPDYFKFKNDFFNLEMDNNMYNKISTSKFILNDPKYDNLKKYFEHEASTFLNRSCWPAADRSNKNFDGLQLTTTWINRSDTGESHHMHQHTYSIVSAVVFLTDCKDNGNLSFRSSQPTIPYADYDDKYFLSGIHQSVEKESSFEDHIVLFLSNVFHSVSEIKGDRSRFTLSFNTWWLGTVSGDRGDLASLKFDKM